MQIRDAIPSDADLIFRFITELAVYEKCEDQVAVTPALLREQLSSPVPPFKCLIAERISEDDGSATAVGFALYFFGYSTWTGNQTLFLEDLYVTPCARGSGAGLALMRTLAQTAVNSGCSRFEWNVLDWNQPAINFYESIGAFPMDGWTRYRLTEDALLNLCGSTPSPNAVLQIA